VVPYPQVSPPKPWICLSSPPYSLHAPSISFFSTQNMRPHFIREWKWAKYTTFSVPIFNIWTSQETSILWWCKCWLSLQNITISNIFEKSVSSDIGL
jgi:hypothetical protein